MKHKIEDFLAAFVKATESTLKDLCNTPIRSSRILTAGNLPKEPANYAALIGITSSVLQGSMSVHFPETVFLTLMSGMLGEPLHSINPELEDGAAEITNIIFGNAKTKLNELDFKIQMALPTLIRGKRIESIGSSQTGKQIGVEFVLDTGPLWIIFELNPRSSTEVRPPESPNAVGKKWSPEMLLEFVKAVRKTLEVQFGAQIEVGQPFRKSKNHRFHFDVGSIIGVTDRQFSGFFGMYYQESTFLKLMNHLLGSEFTELSDEIQDGASEITNICFGVAKQVLNQQGHSIQMALPSLIRGLAIESTHLKGDDFTITVPLTTQHGSFWIEFGYKETGA